MIMCGSSFKIPFCIYITHNKGCSSVLSHIIMAQSNPIYVLLIQYHYVSPLPWLYIMSQLILDGTEIPIIKIALTSRLTQKQRKIEQTEKINVIKNLQISCHFLSFSLPRKEGNSSKGFYHSSASFKSFSKATLSYI